MTKKNATDRSKQKGKPDPTAKAGKGKKGRELMTRGERREKGKAGAAKKAAKAKLAPPVHEPEGLTLAQLGASGLTAKKKPTVRDSFEQTLLEVVAEQTRQFESAGPPVSLPVIPEPEIRTTFGIFGGEVFNNISIEDIVEPIGDTATRNVVAAEVRALLEKTGLIFNAYRKPSILATPSVAVEDAFEEEPEDSPLRFRLAEVVLADNPGEAIEELLEEVYDRILELQIVTSALDPESELEKSARLGLIDEATATRLKKAATEETVRLDLSQRLAGLTASAATPAEVDETFATLIAESAQAAEVQRRERAAFRKTLSQGLRQRKEREGRRFSKSSEESGDEEFIRFLLSHRGDLAAVRDSLPFHLREQVETLLKDGEWKGPLLRQIAVAITTAERRWADLKSRLAASANDPEKTVAKNAAVMKNLLGDFAQIQALHVQLEELDQPQPVAVGVLKTLRRDKSWRGNFAIAAAMA